MRYREIQPSSHLARYVKCYWTLEASSASPSDRPEPVIPDGRIELIFNLADPFCRYYSDGNIETQPLGIVAGQMRNSAVIGPSGVVSLFGVRFRYAGAAPFFAFP